MFNFLDRHLSRDAQRLIWMVPVVVASTVVGSILILTVLDRVLR